jgi:inorganic triphosphatase YgiF
MEIESKYIVNPNDADIFGDVMQFVRSSNAYTVSEPVCFFQRDEYYDYSDYHLSRNGESIRMRSRDSEFSVTYKKVIDDFDAERVGNQTIRIEKEVATNNADIFSSWPLITDSISDLDKTDPKQLINILVIKNNRTKFTMKKDEFLLEIVFDDVAYCCGGDDREYREKQIEVELKSPYEYRINLRLFTEVLESRFSGRITPNSQSKLMRGLSIFRPEFM